MSLPSVVIIVLNWNGRDDTLACLSSLDRLEYPAYSIVVVDNGSGDDSVSAIRSRFPNLTVLETGANLGYVGGNNFGIEHARTTNAEYVLLLNNDTEVAPDMLTRLVEVTEADSRIGGVGPTIYYFDQRDVVWSAGGAIDWARGNTRMLGLDEADTGQFGKTPRSVDFVTGCALLVRMSVFDQVGTLDPRFFAYYEETEWCVRASRAGFTILHVPGARMWHKISALSRDVSPIVLYYMTRNRLLFLSVIHAGWRAWAYTLFVDYLRTLLSWSVRPKWRSKREQRVVMLHAISDYFAGRGGPWSLRLG